MRVSSTKVGTEDSEGNETARESMKRSKRKLPRIIQQQQKRTGEELKETEAKQRDKKERS